MVWAKEASSTEHLSLLKNGTAKTSISKLAEKTNALIKVSIDNLKAIGQLGTDVDPRDNLMVGRDGEVRFDGKEMYRKTKGDREMWRMVDAGGNFFRADSNRPPEIISVIWDQLKAAEKKAMQTQPLPIMYTEQDCDRPPGLIEEIVDA